MKAYLHFFLLAASCTVYSQEIISTSFFSNALEGKEIPAYVYLPEDYDENGEPYNFYIFLHGCCGNNPNSFIEDFEFKLNHMIGDGRIDPLVVIFPSAQGEQFGNRHLWFNSERNGNYSDLITEDLLEWAHDNYNLSETRRAVGGFSMGADGALRMALYHPDKFKAVISHSSLPTLDFLLDFIPNVLNESGETEPPYTYNPNGGFSSIFYGIASAWSPNLENPNLQLDFPLDENGELIDSVFNRWKEAGDIEAIIQRDYDASRKVPTPIYFDAGISELLYSSNTLLDEQLTNLIQQQEFEIDYKFLEFAGGHVISRAKIDSSLIWLNECFENSVISPAQAPHPKNAPFKIFPNPATSTLSIVWPQDISTHKLGEVHFFNAAGQLVHRILVKEDTSLDVSSLSPGIYQMTLLSKEGEQLGMKKIVVQQ